MKRFGLLLTALIVTSAFAQPASIPLELAKRLSGPDAVLFVGKLPPKQRLGFDLLTPPETRVVGAAASKIPDPSYNFTSVYLTSAQNVPNLTSFYQKLFQPSVWQRGREYDQGGFLPAGQVALSGSLTFCRISGETGTDVYFTLISQAHETLVDIQVNSYNNVQSGSSACGDSDDTYIELPFPTLTAPKKSTSGIVEYLSGSGRGNGSSIIVLKTDLGAEGLLEHYAQQLKAEGWREQGSAVNRTQTVQTAVYHFRYKNAAYVGTLQITPLAKRRYLAQLTVIKTQ